MYSYIWMSVYMFFFSANFVMSLFFEWTNK